MKYGDALPDGTSAVTRDIEAAWDSTFGAPPDEIDRAVRTMVAYHKLKRSPELMAAAERRAAEMAAAVAQSKGRKNGR